VAREKPTKKFSVGACIKAITAYNARPAIPISQFLFEGLDGAQVWS
jgi:hypothetical protein